MPYFRNSSQAKFRRFLKKNGFELEEGGLHAIAIHIESGTKIVYPRHNKISAGVTRKLCKQLEQLGFDRKILEKEILS